jgi:hypothetical protein
VPLLRPAGMAGRPWRAPRRCHTVVGQALAVASLPLGPGQHALTLRFAASAWPLSAGRRRVVFRHVTIIQRTHATAAASPSAALIRPECPTRRSKFITTAWPARCGIAHSTRPRAGPSSRANRPPSAGGLFGSSERRQKGPGRCYRVTADALQARRPGPWEAGPATALFPTVRPGGQNRPQTQAEQGRDALHVAESSDRTGPGPSSVPPDAGSRLTDAGNWWMATPAPNRGLGTKITGSLPQLLMWGLPPILPSQRPRRPEQGEPQPFERTPLRHPPT